MNCAARPPYTSTASGVPSWSESFRAPVEVKRSSQSGPGWAPEPRMSAEPLAPATLPSSKNPSLWTARSTASGRTNSRQAKIDFLRRLLRAPVPVHSFVTPDVVPSVLLDISTPVFRCRTPGTDTRTYTQLSPPAMPPGIEADANRPQGELVFRPGSDSVLLGFDLRAGDRPP